MYNRDVVKVNVLNPKVLELFFEDGTMGVINIEEIVGEFNNIFEPLLDPVYFSMVKVDPILGTIVWPNGADICPDVLYAKVNGLEIV